MIVNVLGILPHIWDLRTTHPSYTQPCYADYDEMGGTFVVIQQHLDNLMLQGPLQGYFLEPIKSILVVFSQSIMPVEAFFWEYGL